MAILFTLIAMGWKLKFDMRKKKRKDGIEEDVYEPEVLDLSKVSTPVEMLATAEMMAEDAHDRWASNLKKTSSA